MIRSSPALPRGVWCFLRECQLLVGPWDLVLVIWNFARASYFTTALRARGCAFSYAARKLAVLMWV